MEDSNLISSYTVEDGINDGHFTDVTQIMRFMLREHAPETFKFDPMRIVITPGIKAMLMIGPMMNIEPIVLLLVRHLRCDWGTVDPDDAKANDRDLANKEGRLLSSYLLDEGEKAWIITEPGVTTILLPEEY